jgi:hypothetical protein
MVYYVMTLTLKHGQSEVVIFRKLVWTVKNTKGTHFKRKKDSGEKMLLLPQFYLLKFFEPGNDRSTS